MPNPTFTRRHYEKIAKLLGHTLTASPNHRRGMTDAFIAMFTEDNPRFSQDRFLAAVRKASEEALTAHRDAA
jgi:hypothetical protein